MFLTFFLEAKVRSFLCACLGKARSRHVPQVLMCMDTGPGMRDLQMEGDLKVRFSKVAGISCTPVCACFVTLVQESSCQNLKYSWFLPASRPGPQSLQLTLPINSFSCV